VPTAPEVVIELSDDDEPQDSPLPGAAAAPAAPGVLVTPRASVIPSVPGAAHIPGPSAPRFAARPDTSSDKEFARRLFVELNREAMGIPKDGGLVVLSSDDEEEVIGEEADEEEEEDEEDKAAGSGSPPRG
jgi:hypothetical protein